MNIKSGIDWTKSVIALALLCMVFSFGAPAQDDADEPLDEEAVAALVEELAGGLAELVGDEDQAAAIAEKWDAREDLAGKTRTQILNMLFADVRSVINDKQTLDAVWSNWNESRQAEEDSTALTPDLRKTFMPVVIRGGGNENALSTVNVPVRPYIVRIVDEKGRPVAGARVSMRLYSGRYGNGMFAQIEGRNVEDGVTWTATTDSQGQCTFVVFPQGSSYTVSVASAQGKPIRFTTGSPGWNQGFGEGKWISPYTYEVYSEQGWADNQAKEQTDETDLAKILLTPEDNWSRTGWTPEWAEMAMQINGTFNAPVSDKLRAKFTNYQRIVGGLNILKVALTPASYDRLRQLYTFVQTHPRSNESAVGAVPVGDKNVEISIPFKQPPDPNLFQRCKEKADAGEPGTLECGRALASVIPYQNRWNKINLSCLSNPGLVPVANEFNALVMAQTSGFDAGLIKDDYPLFPGTEISKNNYGPPDARGWICSALVKNEMSRDMLRDGFSPAIINQVIAEQLTEERPIITSANIGGKVEKASDQQALIDYFSQKGQVVTDPRQQLGSVKRLSENEPKESFRARVEAMLKNTIDPVSGRRLDDSLVIFRVKTLSGRDPAKELMTADIFLEHGSVHLYDSYDNSSALTSRESLLSAYITFSGKVRPGQPIPDKRDLAVAAYGWIIGAREDDESSGPYLGLVVRRWVLFNINTGEIYGTSEANGNGNNYGQLFRLDR